MPPKGWRKNADGSYPQPIRELELKSIDEILFPRSIVQRLSKEITNSDSDNMTMAKDSLLALQRSATVFVSHMLFHAKMVAGVNDRKHVNAQDIIAALENSEYSGFIPEVKQKLSLFEANVEAKRKKKLSTAEKSKQSEESDAKRLKEDTGRKPDVDVVEVEEEDEEEIDDDDDDNVNEPSDTEMAENNSDTEELLDDSNTHDDYDKVEEMKNPISIMSKEDDELEGATIEEQDHHEEEVEDDEDDL